jgi:type I restriction enzyme S subunit
MCDVLLPIPSIEQQREIVSEYETISKRIKLNEQIIKNLEATAQTLYRKMFVEGIDKENLPEGWRIGTLGEIAEIIMGQSPDGETYNLEGDGIIFYQGRTDFERRFPTARVYTTSPTRYAKEGDILLSVRAPVGDINIASHDCCIGRGLASLRAKNECQSYLYYQLQNLSDIFNISDDEGTIFGSITKDDLHNIGVAIPSKQIIKEFENMVSAIDNEIKLKDNELNILTELQSLLLAKMGQ